MEARHPRVRKLGDGRGAERAALVDELRSYNDLYQRAGVPLPDGEYEVTLIKATLERSKSSNNPMLVWHLTVVDQEFAGCEIRKFTSLAKEGGLAALRRDLRTCGVDLQKLEELPKVLYRLANLSLLIKVKAKDGSLQITFLEMLVDEQSSDEAYIGDGSETFEEDDDEESQ